jgi:hypothetical protein
MNFRDIVNQAETEGLVKFVSPESPDFADSLKTARRNMHVPISELSPDSLVLYATAEELHSGQEGRVCSHKDSQTLTAAEAKFHLDNIRSRQSASN